MMSGKQFSLDSRMDLVVHSSASTERQRAIKEDSEDTRDGSKARCVIGVDINAFRANCTLVSICSIFSVFKTRIEII